MLLGSSAGQKKTYEKLTSNITPLKEEKQALLWGRMVAFNQAEGKDTLVATGEKVFSDNCAPCHQVNGNGCNVGPTLTGIGNWGDNALAVQILVPHGRALESLRT